MFAVIYRFHLKPHQETVYKEYWETITDYFIKQRGALGSCLHKGEDGLWVAYSRWPDKATRDSSWTSDGNPNDKLPPNIYDTILMMQQIKRENSELEQFDEICLEVIADKLIRT